MTHAKEIGPAALSPDVLASWKHGSCAAPGDLRELVMIQITPEELPREMLVSVTQTAGRTRCQVVCEGRCDLEFVFTPPAGTLQQRLAAVIRAALDWRVTERAT